MDPKQRFYRQKGLGLICLLLSVAALMMGLAFEWTVVAALAIFFAGFGVGIIFTLSSP